MSDPGESPFPGVPPRLRFLHPSRDLPLYFVTACVFKRRALLATDVVHGAFAEYARTGAEQHGIAVGRYVIMPDHLHLFIRCPPPRSLGVWMRGLKRVMELAIPVAVRDRVWQPGFFDHVLRTSESYGQKWEYVRSNPVRAGLVARAEDWPLQGEVVLIDRF